MNRHFNDARYYLRRAGEHVKRGVETELDPYVAKVRELAGREAEPEPSPLDEARETVRETKTRVGSEARRTVDSVRDRVRARRT